MKYLLQPHREALGVFVNGQLWEAVKQCLRDRRPPVADATDPSHVAAAKGHRCAAFDAAIEAIEALPFEHDETPADAFARPAVAITED